MTVEDHQVSINRWTARAVPVFILGASGYVIYVVVQRICGKYSLSWRLLCIARFSLCLAALSRFD